MENVKSLYILRTDVATKSVKAVVELDNGEKKEVSSLAEVNYYASLLAKQNGMSSGKQLTTLPLRVYQCANLHDEDGNIRKDIEAWYNHISAGVHVQEQTKEQTTEQEQTKEQTTEQEQTTGLSLNKSSEYEGKPVQNFNVGKAIKHGVAVASVAAILIAAPRYFVACKQEEKVNFAETETTSEVEETTLAVEETSPVIEETSPVIKTGLPSTWEEYANEYPDSVQKEFLLATMQNNVLPNLKEVTLSNGEVLRYGLTMQEANAVRLYVDMHSYSNEDLYAILGDYDLSQLRLDLHSAMRKIADSIFVAKGKDDVLTVTCDNEVANQLVSEYVSLIIDWKNAEKSEEKKAIREKIEAKLRANFFERAEGEVFVDRTTDPATYFLVLAQITPAIDNYGINIPEDMKFYLRGQENSYATSGESYTVIDGGQEIQVETEGRDTLYKIDGWVNSLCGYVADCLGNDYRDYRLVMQVKEEKIADTYEYGYLCNLGNQFAVDSVKWSLEELTNPLNLEEASIEEILAILDSLPFSEEIPYGGKPGDSFSGTTEVGVELTEEQVNASFSPSQIAEEEKKAEEEAKKNGVITNDEYNQKVDEQDKIKNEANKEPVKEVVDKKDNITGSVVGDRVEEGTITTDPSGATEAPTEGESQEIGGDHHDNPNQQPGDNGETPTVPSEPETPPVEETEEVDYDEAIKLPEETQPAAPENSQGSQSESSNDEIFNPEDYGEIGGAHGGNTNNAQQSAAEPQFDMSSMGELMGSHSDRESQSNTPETEAVTYETEEVDLEEALQSLSRKVDIEALAEMLLANAMNDSSVIENTRGRSI